MNIFYILLDRARIVRWVSESARPFDIVQDHGFLRLMKAGRPEFYIPSPSTVARDVRIVFARARQQIAKLLGVRSYLRFQAIRILTRVTTIRTMTAK